MDSLKDFANNVLKSKFLKIGIAIILILLVLLPLAVYYITIEDGIFKAGDWESAPYAASTYTKNVTIGEDGIVPETTAQELWDKMIAEGNNVEKYLDAPEELEKLMNAEIITQYPKIGNSGAKLDGIIEFERNKTDGTSVILKYIDIDTFNIYIENKNLDILNYFAIDEQGNLLIAIVDETREELTSNDSEMNIADYTTNLTASNVNDSGNYSKTEYNIYPKTINYKSVVSKYTLPFQYLWTLIVIGDDKGVGLELAELAENSQIIISIYDNITTTVNESTYKYKKQRKIDVSATATANYEGLTSSDSWEPADEWEEETQYEIVHRTTYKNNTPLLDVTKADVWIVDFSKIYTYQSAEQTSQQKNEKDIDGEEYGSGEEKSSESGNGSDLPEYNRFKDKLNKLESDLEESAKNAAASSAATNNTTTNNTTTNNTDTSNNISNTEDNVSISISASITSCSATYYKHVIDKHQEDVTTVYSQNYIAGNVINNPKVEKKTKEEIENGTGQDNFVTILSDGIHAKARKKITDEITGWLFELLETNPDTVNMVDLTKYLLYKVTDRSYGVTEYDFSEYENSIFSDYSSFIGDYIVKTNDPGSAPVVNDKSKLEEGIRIWLRTASAQKNNALRVLDTVIECQEKYNVNAVFTLAFLRSETGIGTADTNYVKRDNNWGSWALGTSYPSPENNIETITRGIATGSNYFTQGRISVSTIAQKYCPNIPEYPTQCEGWIEKVQTYMSELYSAMGISAGGEIATGGEGTIGVYTASNGKKFNLYLQGSGAPWANEDYGNSHSMAKAGCGPTAAAIIASGYNASINPSTFRAKIVNLYGLGNHSSSTCVGKAFNELLPNVSTRVVTAFSENEIKQCLTSGGQVWLVVQKCKYTSDAHCIALVDYNPQTDQVYVAHGTAKGKPYGWDSLSYIKQCFKSSGGVLYVGGN